MVFGIPVIVMRCSIYITHVDVYLLTLLEGHSITNSNYLVFSICHCFCLCELYNVCITDMGEKYKIIAIN